MIIRIVNKGISSAKEAFTLRRISLKTKDQRVVLVFGCGGNRDVTKRPVMGEIATRLADFVVITSDNSREESPDLIISQIIEGVGNRKNYIIIKEREKAIKNTVDNAKKNDIIILAGKGHEKYEINSFGKFPFDEKKIVEKIVSERYGIY